MTNMDDRIGDVKKELFEMNKKLDAALECFEQEKNLTLTEIFYMVVTGFVLTVVFEVFTEFVLTLVLEVFIAYTQSEDNQTLNVPKSAAQARGWIYDARDE